MYILAHRCSLSGFEQFFRNRILVEEQEWEEHKQICHKYVFVYIYVCTYRIRCPI